MTKTKINITLGVLTGLLVGFVLGTAFGVPDASLKTSGKTQGNISSLSRQWNSETPKEENTEEPADTLTFTANDGKGNNWNIVIVKE